MDRFLPLAFVLASCTAPASLVDPAEVQAFLDEYRTAAATGNAAETVAYYTEDVVILEDGRVAYRGREAIREAFQAFEGGSGGSLTFNGTEITPISADAALVQTLFSQTFGSEGYQFSGAISLLARRQNGRWFIHRSHTSTARAEVDWSEGQD